MQLNKGKGYVDETVMQMNVNVVTIFIIIICLWFIFHKINDNYILVVSLI